MPPSPPGPSLTLGVTCGKALFTLLFVATTIATAADQQPRVLWRYSTGG